MDPIARQGRSSRICAGFLVALLLAGCGGASTNTSSAKREVPLVATIKMCLIKSGAHVVNIFDERGGLEGSVLGYTPHGADFEIERSAPEGRPSGGAIRSHLRPLLGVFPDASDRRLVALCTRASA